MISINELIQQAYTRCGLVGEGQSVNGTKAMSALHELNDLVQMLNQQEYLSDNLRVFDVRTSNAITIGNGPDFDILVSRPPSHIKSVSRKVGDRFVPLVSSNLESVNSVSKGHLATQFTYNVDYDPKARGEQKVRENAIVVETADELPECTREDVENSVRWYATKTNSWGFAMSVGTPSGPVYTWATYAGSPTKEQLDAAIYEYGKGQIRGVITLDSCQSSEYKVIFFDEIPEYTLSDKIFLQDMYKSLLLAGLTYKLAVRFKLQEWLQVYKEDFEDQKSIVKRINSTNRNMVWNDCDGSYMDDYVNGRAGFGW